MAPVAPRAAELSDSSWAHFSELPSSGRVWQVCSEDDSLKNTPQLCNSVITTTRAPAPCSFFQHPFNPVPSPNFFVSTHSIWRDKPYSVNPSLGIRTIFEGGNRVKVSHRVTVPHTIFFGLRRLQLKSLKLLWSPKQRSVFTGYKIIAVSFYIWIWIAEPATSAPAIIFSSLYFYC